MAEKWIGPARKRMERKGTVGTLRAIAQRRGLLSGKGDTLSASDLRTLAARARRMKGKDGKLTAEGTELMAKVRYAANTMGVDIGKAKK